LLGPGFGVDVDRDGRVWFGDFGWGKDNPVGSVSLFDPDARPISPAPNGYTDGGVNRVQGVTVDQKTGNVWFASWGNGLVVMYPAGNHENAVCYPPNGVAPPDCNPFDVAIASDGSAWVTNSNADASSLFHLSYTNGTLQLISETKIGKVMKGIDIDSNGIIWTGSGGDDHVYAFDTNGVLIGGYQGGGINGPWGLTLDGNDNVWVANFGPLAVGNVFTGRLTQLAGANPNTRPSKRLTGDALSPQTGYTLPSAGEPVLLNNLDPLYGPDAPPSYIPMMRTTGINIDAAGNVWTCNNWKPDFNNDLFGEPFKHVAANPGGDGMLIWVGLAKPRE
jgi:sugar lactone lactonase YvrE